jgi:hypothetical protein
LLLISLSLPSSESACHNIVRPEIFKLQQGIAVGNFCGLDILPFMETEVFTKPATEPDSELVISSLHSEP